LVFRDAATSSTGKAEKRGCKWILLKHATIDAEEVWNAIKKEEGENEGDGGAINFKFEPFILHLQCRTLELAKKIHTLSLESGFRNTGLTVGKSGKLVLAVRSTHGLELPLSDDVSGRILVSREYVDTVVAAANAKLTENGRKHRKLEDACTAYLSESMNDLGKE
jgi:tRNA wybutosine-synthesizing protein 3